MYRPTFIIIFLLQVDFLRADHCVHLLNSLANAQMLFVQCSMHNAVPVTVCVGCAPSYKSMLEGFKNLTSDEGCSEKYFDKDRINIISTTQSILTGLWARAYCEDCFNGDNVSTFNNKCSLLTTCFNKYNNSECIACLADYEDLNNFYNKLDQHNNGKVCYDMQDKMNRTRSQWSKDFNCCKRQFNITLFLTASISAIALTILFYLSTFLYGLRRERNHGILDADEITPLINENTRLCQEVHNPTPATAVVSSNTNISKKRLQNGTDSDTSVDETTYKKNH